VTEDLELIPRESIDELRRYLDTASRSLLVGSESEAHRRFFIVNVAGETPLAIGLCASGLSPRARVLWQAKLGRALIGSDCTVTAVDVRLGKIITGIQLDGAFFDFIMPDENGAAVVHELGAMGVGFDGSVRWTVSSEDVVENFCVGPDRVLELGVADAGRALRVSLADGNLLETK